MRPFLALILIAACNQSALPGASCLPAGAACEQASDCCPPVAPAGAVTGTVKQECVEFQFGTAQPSLPTTACCTQYQILADCSPGQKQSCYDCADGEGPHCSACHW